jgi:hypothetical protein
MTCVKKRTIILTVVADQTLSWEGVSGKME